MCLVPVCLILFLVMVLMVWYMFDCHYLNWGVAAHIVARHILSPATIHADVHGAHCRQHIMSPVTIYADNHGTYSCQASELEVKLRDDVVLKRSFCHLFWSFCHLLVVTNRPFGPFVTF